MNYFYAGQEFAHKGVRYRVREGTRCQGDIVLEFCIDGWYRPHIAHTFILAAFKYQVEENNYGKEGKIKRGFGGAYLLDALKRACVNGWQLEAEVIEQQRNKIKTIKNPQKEFWDEMWGKPFEHPEWNGETK